MKRKIVIAFSGIGVMMLVALSSCITQKSLVHSSQPLSADALRQMEPQKVYKIHYTNGFEYKVRVDSTGDSTLYATTKSIITRDSKGHIISQVKEAKQKPFVQEYKEILKNADEVTTRKFNPILSSVIIIIPVVLLIILGIYFTWLLLFSWW